MVLWLLEPRRTTSGPPGPTPTFPHGPSGPLHPNRAIPKVPSHRAWGNSIAGWCLINARVWGCAPSASGPGAGGRWARAGQRLLQPSGQLAPVPIGDDDGSTRPDWNQTRSCWLASTVPPLEIGEGISRGFQRVTRAFGEPRAGARLGPPGPGTDQTLPRPLARSPSAHLKPPLTRAPDMRTACPGPSPRPP